MLGFGLAAALAFTVPVVSIVVPSVAIVGATMMAIDIERNVI
jgi:hypothetical protein